MGTRLKRPELYEPWSLEFISCPPGFSHMSIVGQNEQSRRSDVTNRPGDWSRGHGDRRVRTNRNRGG